MEKDKVDKEDLEVEIEEMVAMVVIVVVIEEVAEEATEEVAIKNPVEISVAETALVAIDADMTTVVVVAAINITMPHLDSRAVVAMTSLGVDTRIAMMTTEELVIMGVIEAMAAKIVMEDANSSSFSLKHCNSMSSKLLLNR
jgi:hypothetical protein